MSVVEVTWWDDLDLDRALAATYAGGGIPTYWIVNIKGRQLEVYSDPQDGAYPAPAILGDDDSVEVIIDGLVAGTIRVADLLPPR